MLANPSGSVAQVLSRSPHECTVRLVTVDQSGHRVPLAARLSGGSEEQYTLPMLLKGKGNTL